MMPELALKEAASKSLDIFMAQLERDMPSDAHYVPSPALDASIQKLCRKAAHPYFRKFLHSAAALLLAAATAGGMLLAASPQARAAFWGWVKEISRNTISYQYSGGTVKNTHSLHYALGSIPAGYTEYLASPQDGFLIYENENGELLNFIYIEKTDETSLTIGSEALPRTITVNGRPAELIPSNGTDAPAIVWTDEYDTMLTISGFFSEEELIHLAEGVKKIS